MKLKSFFLLCTALSASTTAFADSNSFAALAPSANIQARNWSLSGSLNFVKNSGRNNNSTEFNTALGPEYFLIDRFSLGMALGIDAETDQDTVATLGPKATYYFWNDGKLASFVKVGFRFGLTDSTVNSIIHGSVGAEYFFIPSVSVGPALFLNHYDSKSNDYRRYGITANIGVYL